MTCDEARARLSALLDQALGPDERGQLEAHVATCVDCRRELGLLKNTVALLHSVNPVHAPAGFADRVLAAARPAPWYRRLQRALSLPWSVKLPLAAAAALLVGVAVAHLLEMAPELQRAARVESPSPAVTESQEPPATPAGAPGQKAKAEPEPATRERREGRARDLADEATDATQRRDLAKAAPAPAPATAPERKAESATGAAAPARESAREGARPDAATSRRSALRTTAADVSGRLVVTDREAAARGLTELVARTGGAEVARSAGADTMVIELTIPRAAWSEFTRELAALGAWTPDREPPELPAQVRVALRISE
jgi:hypothetical protein